MSLEERECRNALRSLILPLYEPLEEQSLQGALEAASDRGIDARDFPIAIKIEYSKWLESGVPSPLLVSVVKSAIVASRDDIGSKLAEKYFDIHRKLQLDQYLLSFVQSTLLLSYSRLIASLASESQITASQLSILLNARDSRLNAGRQNISYILHLLGIQISLSEDQTLELFATDQLFSQQVFSDASLSDCSQMVGVIANRLGGNLDISARLDVLASDENLGAFNPYLQILHYQCTVAEFYDFAVKDMYEFNPRGAAALTLFENYPSSINSAGNPFLNNAKSVEQLTLSWARSKKKSYFRAAIALYELLDILQSFGFSARRELATWIRFWIHRVIMLASEDDVELPKSVSQEFVPQLLSYVATSNTQTSGILEQRLVDAVSKLNHPSPTWKARGLKDAVNTTNLSSKKLGDCDYQNNSKKKVVAYEAHGGKLSKIYLEDHVRTLKKTLPLRIAEWETFSDTVEWDVNIVFVAHEIACDVENLLMEINGIRVSISSTTYTNFFHSIDIPKLAPLVDSYVLDVLSKSRVPKAVREKFIFAISSVSPDVSSPELFD